MSERPVPAFELPEVVQRPQVSPLPMPPPQLHLPAVPLLLATATMDHSGRVGDKKLLRDGLHWHPGDRTSIHIAPATVVVRRDPHGRHRLDPRCYVFIPAAARSLLRIDPGDRVMLVGAPEHDQLMVHHVAVVADLLSRLYASPPDGPDVP